MGVFVLKLFGNQSATVGFEIFAWFSYNFEGILELTALIAIQKEEKQINLKIVILFVAKKYL